MIVIIVEMLHRTQLVLGSNLLVPCIRLEVAPFKDQFVVLGLGADGKQLFGRNFVLELCKKITISNYEPLLQKFNWHKLTG